MTYTNPYECPECHDQPVECESCGQETECDVCGGAGLDISKIDVPAFEKANLALIDEGGASWSWIEFDGDKGTIVGRMNQHRGIAYADFLRK